MQLRLELDPATQILTITPTTPMSLDEWKSQLRRLWSDPTYRSHARLWDFRAAVFEGLSPEEVEKLARFARENDPTPPIRAAMVTDGDYDFGQTRVYLAIRSLDPEHRRVFRDMSSAEQWLSSRREARG